MPEILEQRVTVDLPTLLVDARGSQVKTGHPGLETMGYLAIPGTMELGLRLRCPDDDPSRVTFDLRVLDAHYSPPEGCSQRALEICQRANLALTENLTGQ